MSKITRAEIMEALVSNKYKTRIQQAEALGITRVYLWQRLREDPTIEEDIISTVIRESKSIPERFVSEIPERLRRQFNFAKKRHIRRAEIRIKVDKSGYVYLARAIEAVPTKRGYEVKILIKIGQSTDPKNRFKSTDALNEIIIIFAAKVSDMRGLENYLHTHFAYKHVPRRSGNSEYFDLNDEEIKYARDEILLNSIDEPIVDDLYIHYDWAKKPNACGVQT